MERSEEGIAVTRTASALVSCVDLVCASSVFALSEILASFLEADSYCFPSC